VTALSGIDRDARQNGTPNSLEGNCMIQAPLEVVDSGSSGPVFA
jgi:hypothetical protein